MELGEGSRFVDATSPGIPPPPSHRRGLPPSNFRVSKFPNINESSQKQVNR